ncbi:bridge-like lipid transfer protein family member 3A isoform X1 [Syngnathus typhle]|uniref:bridge-like lipid transfer protein family member 3A isoform X1 n=1 Tax=Syngnathus typhle TaxID=161592 RepID=UPI002A6B8948|nr:bridge-like lipid transfer protein family member 3A isoform X1 [Syngnathus typhle]
MAGIIKKQILKHLSRFAKNLSPDKINLSTLKGEGQLSNLELDEEVLQNMLDLPTWLAVTRVYCNKAAIRIQWTKLKTSPICLFLDKVEVEMRTCEEPRPPNGPSPIAITEGQSEYGFAEKVVEGMSVRINSITIKVHALAFHASFELWQLQGNSLNPKWQRSDLRFTRITDPKRGEVLTFKEINWQTLRIEADAIESDDQDLGSTPLRLITNQGRIRIALKRRIKDCNVLASKLLFILDDLLWVLTDSQLKAIIRYAKSLSEAMEKSAQQRKSMTAESLQTAPPSPGLHNLWAQSTPAHIGSPNNMSQYFDRFDVKESSYHTFISRLDLHVCNDSSSVAEDLEEPPGLQGAMQLTFRKLGFDYYPVHRQADGCRHWERHSGAMEAQAQWAGKLLHDYQMRAESFGFPGPCTETPGPHHDSPARTPPDGTTSPKSNLSDKEQSARNNSGASPLSSTLKSLRSSCMVVRIDDVDIHQVSTKSRQNKKTQPLLSCNRKVLHLPDSVPAVHLQFTEYYFPNNPSFSVPTSNLYGQVNGLQLCVDPESVLWINLFSRGLLHTLDQVKAFYHLQDSSKADEHVDIRLDAAQLKVVIPLDFSILDHPERPRTLSVTVPQMALSNTRHCPHGSKADLRMTCDTFASCSFFQPEPPCPYPRDRSAFCAIPSIFFQHSQESAPSPTVPKQLRSQDVWSLSLSRVALGFDGTRRLPKGKTHPFVEPFAVSVWMCKPAAWFGGSSHYPTSPSEGHQLPSEQLAHRELAHVHVIAHVITPVKMWLNHYQYVALLRMKDAMARLGVELSQDLKDMKQSCDQKSKPTTVCLALLLDSVEVGLLLPPAGTDHEEEVPHTPETDSPSLTDSDISPAHHSTDLIPENSGLENGVCSLSTAHDDQDGTVEEACEAVEEALEGDVSAILEDTPVLSPQFSPGNSPRLSREPSTFSLEGELSSAINVTKDVTKDAISASLDLTKGAFSKTRDAFSILSRGSGMSKLFSPQTKEQVQHPEEPSPSLVSSLRHQMMKQSPSLHSLDSAILDGSLPDENLSVGSDASDNLGVLMDSESGVDSARASVNPSGSPALGTEGGSSADLSSSLSFSTEDVSADMSSVLLLILNGTSCTVEIKGEDQVIAVQAQNLSSAQMGNVRVLDLLAGVIQGKLEPLLPDTLLTTYNMYGSPCPQLSLCAAPAHKLNGQGSRGSAAVRMRAESGPSAARRAETSESLGLLDVRVQDCHVELLTSTVANIGPFLEDEFSVDGQPMNVHVSNVTITIKDDSPRIYPTAPQPTSATFVVDELLLKRGEDGIMRLKGLDSPKYSCSGKQQSERQNLQSELSDAQMALTQALSDRDRLLLEIKKYDPEFSL